MSARRDRQGWVESILGTGIRREHRLRCEATTLRERGFECSCPYSWWMPMVARARRERSGPFYGTLDEAVAAKQAQEAEAVELRLRIRRQRETHPSNLTLYEYYAEWLRWGADRWSPSTLRDRIVFYKRMIHGPLGAARIRDLTYRHLEAWIENELATGRPFPSVKFAFGCVKCVLDLAVARDDIHRNPADAIKLPDPPRRERVRDHLTITEYRSLVAACDTLREQALIRLAGEAGLRRGELSALRVSDIDLDRREVVVMRTLVRDAAKRFVEKHPKSGKPRIVPLTTGLVRLLAEYLRDARLTGDALVFCGYQSKASYLKPETVRTTVVGIMVRAGLTDSANPAKARFKLHDLRRTAATLAREAGAAPDVIQGALGHHRTFVTERHYLRNRAHPDIASFADALDRALEGPVDEDDNGEAGAPVVA